MLISELPKGESLNIGNGLSVKMVRKNADGSSEFSVVAQPGASFRYAYGDETATVHVMYKDGCRGKIGTDADRSVKISKQNA